MAQTNKPLIETGQIIPAFTLPGADGMPHSPWDYNQRDHLILLFINSSASSETRDILHRFAKIYSAIREQQCSVLAISPDTVLVNLLSQDELRLPYPLLADPKGEILSRYTPLDEITGKLSPCIVLADRNTILYQLWTYESEADLPAIENLLDTLKHLNKLCTP